MEGYDMVGKSMIRKGMVRKESVSLGKGDRSTRKGGGQGREDRETPRYGEGALR